MGDGMQMMATNAAAPQGVGLHTLLTIGLTGLLTLIDLFGPQAIAPVLANAFHSTPSHIWRPITAGESAVRCCLASSMTLGPGPAASP